MLCNGLRSQKQSQKAMNKLLAT